MAPTIRFSASYGRKSLLNSQNEPVRTPANKQLKSIILHAISSVKGAKSGIWARESLFS